MFTISNRQIATLQTLRAGQLAQRLRARVADIPEYRQLAADDRHWLAWWQSVTAAAEQVGAVTPMALATHAVFSLWFGHRYFNDPRSEWLGELLASDDGTLDYRRLDIGCERLLDLAVLNMEFSAGAAFQDALRRLIDICQRLSANGLPPWERSAALGLVHQLYAPRAEQCDGAAWAAVVDAVEQVSGQFDHGADVRWPLLLAIAVFGIDAWRDPALPELKRETAQVLAMSAPDMLGALQRQALFSGAAMPPPGLH